MSHEGIRIVPENVARKATGQEKELSRDAIDPQRVRVNQTDGTGVEIVWKDGTPATGHLHGCVPHAHAPLAWKDAKPTDEHRASRSRNQKPRCQSSSPRCDLTKSTPLDGMPSASIGTMAIPAAFIPGITCVRSAIVILAASPSPRNRALRLQQSEDILHTLGSHCMTAMLRLEKTLLHRSIQHGE